MTEYNCTCHIDGKTYTLLTVGAITTQQAMLQFNDSVTDEGGDFTRVDGLTLDLIEVE
jgi:hypothetical protein|tara:strand:+ start:173 stop:346 length:174 start_codon:yes stop_codon:yes gene_type:complete